MRNTKEEIKLCKNKNKNGMYGEMPVIKVGSYDICMMSDKDGEDRVWVLDDSDNGGEGGEFKCSLLEPYIKEFFNKHF